MCLQHVKSVCTRMRHRSLPSYNFTLTTYPLTTVPSPHTPPAHTRKISPPPPTHTQHMQGGDFVFETVGGSGNALPAQLASLFLYVSRGASVARKRVRTCALSVCKCEYICAYMHVYAKVRVFTHAHTFNHKCTFATLAGARTYKHTLTHAHTHARARTHAQTHPSLTHERRREMQLQ